MLLKISFNDENSMSIKNQLIETSIKAIVIKYIAIICDQISVFIFIYVVFVSIILANFSTSEGKW